MFHKRRQWRPFCAPPRARAVIEKFRSKDEKIAKTVEQDCDARERCGLFTNLKNHGTGPALQFSNQFVLQKSRKPWNMRNRFEMQSFVNRKCTLC